MIRTYTDLNRIEGFEDRYNYLRTFSVVGLATFGHERWLNQAFYRSTEWRRIRQLVIARDRGLDLGVEGHEIWQDVYIHHMNPISSEDVTQGNPDIFDPEYLISVSLRTHNAIHYGDSRQLEKPYEPRRPGDTKLW